MLDLRLPTVLKELAKSGHKTFAYEAKVRFYAEILRDEQVNGTDIDAWVDYVDKFAVGHLIPSYDRQGLI